MITKEIMSSYDMNPYAILSKSLKGMPATNAQYTVHVHVLCLKKTDLHVHVRNTNLKRNMRILMYTAKTLSDFTALSLHEETER